MELDNITLEIVILKEINEKRIVYLPRLLQQR